VQGTVQSRRERKGLELLLVEDNLDHSEIISRFLSESEFLGGNFELRIDREKKLSDAIRQLKTNNYDLVLLDLNLIDSNAYETLSQIASYVECTPFIVLSSMKQDQLALRSITAGVQDYLIKDQLFDDILGRTVGYALERHRTRQKLRLQSNRGETLLKLAQHSVSESDSFRLAELFCQGIAECLEVEAVEIVHFYSQEEEYEVVGQYGLSEADRKVGQRFKSSVGEQDDYFRRYLKELESDETSLPTISLMNLSAENRFIVGRYLIQREIGSGIVIPLGSDSSRLLGFVAAYTIDSRLFSLEERMFLATACNTLSVALQRIRMEENLKEHISEVEDMGRKKNQLLAYLAHEIRNPVASAISGCDLLEASFDKPNGVDRASLVGRIQKRLRHLSVLLNDLLDISRLSTGMLQLRLQIISLKEVVLEAIDATDFSFQGKQQKLRVKFEECPEIRGDSDRLVQAVSNLLLNASKFSPTGSSTEIVVGRDLKGAYIKVTDSGIGLSKDVRESLFEPFVSVHRVGDSVGVGLALSKQIMDLHHGKIVGKNRLDAQGAEFKLMFPAFQGADIARDSGERLTINRIMNEPLKIVVVDDNRLSAEHAKWCLERGGHSVEIANDGEEGVRVVSRFNPDLVFLDIVMPGMDGYEVLRLIRNTHPDLLIVAYTSFNDSYNKKKMGDAGFSDILTKEPSLDGLVKYLAQNYFRLKNNKQ